MDEAGQRSAGASRRYIMQAVEASLQRLRTDWHRPLPAAPAGPARRRSRRPCARSTSSCGRARCASSAARTCRRSSWSRRRTPRGVTASRRFVSCQDEYSLLARGIERELVAGGEARAAWASCPTSRSPAACSPASTGAARRRRRARGCREAYAPRGRLHHRAQLAHGRGAGQLRRAARPQPARARVRLAAAQRECRERDRRGDLAEQVEANVRAAGWTLSADDLAEIDRITL